MHWKFMYSFTEAITILDLDCSQVQCVDSSTYIPGAYLLVAIKLSLEKKLLEGG